MYNIDVESLIPFAVPFANGFVFGKRTHIGAVYGGFGCREHHIAAKRRTRLRRTKPSSGGYLGGERKNMKASAYAKASARLRSCALLEKGVEISGRLANHAALRRLCQPERLRGGVIDYLNGARVAHW